MEALIKKRIEEAAKEEREQCREDNNEIWRDRPTYNDVEASFIKGATFALQNQWISVGEALPENAELYFVAYKALDMILFSTGCYHSDIKEWYVDGYGYMYDVIHWMHIPSLEGGEE